MERMMPILNAINASEGLVRASNAERVAAFERVLEDAGYIVAPKEPTEAMLEAGRERFRHFALRWMEGHPEVWSAMLAAR